MKSGEGTLRLTLLIATLRAFQALGQIELDLHLKLVNLHIADPSQLVPDS
jgi:hypothetical protein